MGAALEGFWSRILLALIAIEVIAVVTLGVVGAATGQKSERDRVVNRALVGQLQLTDLALWSGASYCRHPSQADFFAPHGDHPAALEHHPAGSLVPPRPAGNEGSSPQLGEP